jgi:hypothetical protein
VTAFTPDLTRDLKADLRDVIERTIIAHPRSQQVAIGASEVGTECPRKLGHKLAGTPRVRPEAPAWRPTVGTAVHSWLEAAFRAENARLGWERYLLEIALDCGDIGTERLTGHGDLYDQLTATTVDWKVPGVTTIKKARSARHPGAQYRVQGHLYGMGWALLGFPVERVAIYFLPAAGELGDGYFWSEPFDPVVAATALKRANSLLEAHALMGDDLFGNLPITADHCTYCPWWKPGATDLRVACPGDPAGIRTQDTGGPAFGRLAQPKGTTA